MRTEENTIDVCLTTQEMEKYLGGKMGDDEQTLIDTHLADCELCCDAMEAMETDEETTAETLNLTESEIAFKEQLAGEGQGKTKPEKRIFSLNTWLGKAAAILFLGMSVYALWQQWKPKATADLYAAHFEPYEDLISTRSSENGLEQLSQQAMAKYNAGEYKEANKLFDEILANQPDDQLLFLYAAISYMKVDRDQESLEILEQLSNQNTAFQETANWYLGLLQLKMENKATALQQFKELAASSGEFSDRAAELVKELD